MRSGDADEFELIGGHVQQGHRLLAGAVERAGVDDAGLAEALVAADVGVAVKEVIVRLRLEDGVEAGLVVAMKDGDFFAVEFEIGERAVAWTWIASA